VRAFSGLHTISLISLVGLSLVVSHSYFIVLALAAPLPLASQHFFSVPLVVPMQL
jgi:hypothetical protein